jgi:hypothetical protein
LGKSVKALHALHMLRRQIVKIPGGPMPKSVKATVQLALQCGAASRRSVGAPMVYELEIDRLFAKRATNAGPGRWMRLFAYIWVACLVGHNSQATSDSHLFRPKQIFGSLVAFFFLLITSY